MNAAMNAAMIPDQPTINLSEIAKVEFFILKRMKELAMGDHASAFKGSGFNFAGLRDWEPGDSISSVDWAASSLTNFSPLIAREFEQDSNATIVAVADASLSTRCGAQGTLIMTAVARCLAAIGLSAVLFQDQFGLITFDDLFQQIATVRPRIGKPHVSHCLDLYQQRYATSTVMGAFSGNRESGGAQGDVTASIATHLRKTSLVPVISDFLFIDAARVIRELAILNASHDVFLLMVDVRFAFEFPDVSAGWVEGYDVETGRSQVFSRREMAQLAVRVGEWQEQMMQLARDRGLDMVRVGLDRWEMENTLVEFVAERRLRKVKMA
jgi:uncharacterized protein (DUF58 family)